MLHLFPTQSIKQGFTGLYYLKNNVKKPNFFIQIIPLNSSKNMFDENLYEQFCHKNYLKDINIIIKPFAILCWAYFCVALNFDYAQSGCAEINPELQ